MRDKGTSLYKNDYGVRNDGTRCAGSTEVETRNDLRGESREAFPAQESVASST